MNKDELQVILRDSKDLLLKAHSCELPSFMVVNCVASNTMRAFHKGVVYDENAPTMLFKHWAYSYLNQSDFKENFKQGKNFDQIHSDAILNLQRFWTSIEGKKPHWYLCAKLVDLLFRFTSNWNEFTKEERNRFFNVANVPIDKYILQTIRDFDPNNSLKIPSNPTMKFIHKDDDEVTKSNYKKVQSKVKDLVGEFPPLLFELFAWHREGITKTDVNDLYPLKR